MSIKELSLKGIYLIEPRVFEDKRGFFYESFRQSEFIEQGIKVNFVQDNISHSKKDTIRGLHYQIDHPQSKLIQCIKGRILDVAVDLRRASSSFGTFITCELSEANKNSLYVPEGFAHGFSVLSDEATISYKCSDYYFPAGERGVKWNDPEIGIDWQVSDPVISDKDQNLPHLSEINKADLFK